MGDHKGGAGRVAAGRAAQIAPVKRSNGGDTITYGSETGGAPESWSIEWGTPTPFLERQYGQADVRRAVKEIEAMRFPNRVPNQALWARQPLQTERHSDPTDLRNALRNHIADDNQVVRVEQQLNDGGWDWEVSYRPFPPDYEP